jgi:hypothetical protein
MQRINLITSRVETIGGLADNEQLEFMEDGDVVIVRTWLQKAARKTNSLREWPGPSSQSRIKTLSGIRSLLDLTNDLVSGLLKKPKICIESDHLGSTDAPNVIFDEDTTEAGSSNENAVENFADNSRSIFTAQYEENKKEALIRLKQALQKMCAALNRLASSTYAGDISTGAALLKLINFAALQCDQIGSSIDAV